MSSASQALELMRQAHARGERDLILAHANSASIVGDDEYASALSIGNILRDNGFMSEAREFYRRVLDRCAGNAFALYEQAILDATLGLHAEALLGLEQLLRANDSDERALSFAARISARIGSKAKASDYANRYDQASSDSEAAAALYDLIKFMHEFPAEHSNYLACSFEKSSYYVSAGIICGWAEAALQNRDAFSLIRLGDGEGAFCRISSQDEALYPNVYRYCRHDRARVWFDDELDIYQSGFVDTAFSLRRAVQSANVVGLPYRSWVNHEYKYCSPTGVVCLTNALRLCQIEAIRQSQSWTTQLVHMDLLQQGHLERLIRRQKRLNVISCLDGAAEALKAVFDLDEVNFYHIPGEKAHKEQLGIAAVEGEHFPSRYVQLMRELDRPLKGELFLVAGGLLGKLYCDRIKRSGGVALDIGSVADVWMGKATRPGMDSKLMLTT